MVPSRRSASHGIACIGHVIELLENIRAIKAPVNTIAVHDHKKALLTRLVARIKSLDEENDEMASEILFLKATIAKLVSDNENMQNLRYQAE